MTFKTIFILSCFFSSFNLMAGGQHTDGTDGNISAPIFSEAPGRLKLEILNTKNKLQVLELEFHEFPIYDSEYSIYKKLNIASTSRRFKKIKRVCKDYENSIPANTEVLLFFTDSPYTRLFFSKSPTASNKLNFNLIKKIDIENKIVCSQKLGEIDRDVFLTTVSNYFQKVAQRYLFTFAETEFLYETGASKYKDPSKIVNEILALTYVETHGKNLAEQLLIDVNVYNSWKNFFYFRPSYQSPKTDSKPILPTLYQDIDEAMKLFFKQSYRDSIVDFLEGFDEFLLQALDIAKFGFEKTQGLDVYEDQIALEFPFYERSMQYGEQALRVAPGSKQWQSLKNAFLLDFSESNLKTAFCRWEQNAILQFDLETHSLNSPAELLKTIFEHFNGLFSLLRVKYSDLECLND
ncbi:MAG: hypothetical protein VX642_05220 [Bdellovibrionota bacterium]|nr:hypothetical protein [Bdellovibrionota bacterium]